MLANPRGRTSVPVQTSANGSSNSSLSSDLLRQVRARDQVAWHRLADLLCPTVFNWARRAGLQPDDASDVVQEVFRAVAANIDTFRREHPADTFRGWLWTITHNKIRDHYRRVNQNPQAAGGTDGQFLLANVAEENTDDSRAPPAGDFRQAVVTRALDVVRVEFEPATWEAFWRSTVDGQGTDQVATSLGLTRAAVRQAKYRVLRKLRQHLEGLID